MSKIAVLSSDKDLNARIKSFCDTASQDFAAVFLDDKFRYLEYLNYELPEISVCNFSDRRIDVGEVLKAIKEDSWLHYGGIIGIHDSADEGELEKDLQNSNVINLIRLATFDFNFPRLLRILQQNRQIVFQRDLQNRLLANISGSFVMDNDPFDSKTYTNLVVNYLFNSNLIDRDKKERLTVALMELLINAIEHGNCRISHQEKSEWLEGGGNIFDLIRKKNSEAAIAASKVYFRYRITPRRSVFAIRDEGEGFDWRSRAREINQENYLQLHGRGIMMAEHYVQNLSFNAKGNEVRFEIEHQINESNVVPQAFESQDEVFFEDGESVFTQGEESNFLYYIVSGTLNIVSDGKVISRLTPDDIFLGEMSFLLNNRRSASVVSVGRSSLLRISKEAFVNVIRENPHYGIFLARLLAQRLARMNVRAGAEGV